MQLICLTCQAPKDPGFARKRYLKKCKSKPPGTSVWEYIVRKWELTIIPTNAIVIFVDNLK